MKTILIGLSPFQKAKQLSLGRDCQRLVREWIDSLPYGDKPPRRQDDRLPGVKYTDRWMIVLTEEQHAKSRTIWKFRQKVREWLDSLPRL